MPTCGAWRLVWKWRTARPYAASTHWSAASTAIDGMLDGMGKGAASRIEAIEGRVSAIERKLNHRGER